MAFVSGGFFLVVDLVDNGNNHTVRTFELDTDADNVSADVATVLSGLGGLTDAVVASHYYYEKLVNDSFAFPAAGVQIENQALLDFQLAGDPTKTGTQSIPAPKAAIFVASSGDGANTVNTGYSAVSTWAALVVTGGKIFISDGEHAASLLGGKRRHVKSRRG